MEWFKFDHENCDSYGLDAGDFRARAGNYAGHIDYSVYSRGSVKDLSRHGIASSVDEAKKLAELAIDELRKLL